MSSSGSRGKREGWRESARAGAAEDRLRPGLGAEVLRAGGGGEECARGCRRVGTGHGGSKQAVTAEAREAAAQMWPRQEQSVSWGRGTSGRACGWAQGQGVGAGARRARQAWDRVVTCLGPVNTQPKGLLSHAYEIGGSTEVYSPPSRSDTLARRRRASASTLSLIHDCRDKRPGSGAEAPPGMEVAAQERACLDPRL